MIIMNKNHFTHTDCYGKAKMVDISDKIIQNRTAIAQGKIFMQTKTIKKIQQNEIEKGDVISVAKIAAIQSAKKTYEIIPLCHSIPITFVNLDFKIDKDHITVKSIAKTSAQTGVEMEALTAVSVALLTLYDMCKAIDQTMRITDIHLIEKIKE